jgi:hypothetical protein
MGAIRTDRGRYDNGEESPDAWRHPHLERHAGENILPAPHRHQQKRQFEAFQGARSCHHPFSARAFTAYARHESCFIRAGQ